MTPFRPIPEATPRKAMTTKRKLASCLAQMRHPDDSARPLVPNAELMTEDEIISSVEFDHFIALELTRRDHPSNIRPLPIVEHRTVKTPRDARMIAKARHNRKREERHREVMAARTTDDDAPRDIRRNRIPNRPFQKGHRPMRARRG